MVILETHKLRKCYGVEPNVVHALDGVDLSVHKGEFVALTGISGSGKSTLLYMLGGLDIPTEGKVIVEGVDLSELDSEQLAIFRRDRVGFIFQSYNLVPVLNVYENIVLPIELGGNTIDGHYIDGIIDTLGISDKRNAMPIMLSGGQQQRVAIARALATKPAIILADEPTGNLDSATSHDVLEVFKTTSERFNQTVILVTHNENIAELLDRTIHIKDGKIVEDIMP